MTGSSFSAQVPIRSAKRIGPLAMLMASIAGVPMLRKRTRPDPYDATGKRIRRPAPINLGSVVGDLDFTVTYPERYGVRHNRRWRHKQEGPSWFTKYRKGDSMGDLT